MSNAFWSPQDEAAYFRHEFERVKEQRNTAFLTGFDAGVEWGISHGLEKAAEVFAGCSELWPPFPPELIKAFAESMKSSIPAISASLTSGLQEARQQAKEE